MFSLFSLPQMQQLNDKLLNWLDKPWVQGMVLLSMFALFALIITCVDHLWLRSCLACAVGLLLLVGYEHCRPLAGNERQLIQLQAQQYRQHPTLGYSYRWRVSREFLRLIQQ